MILQHSVLLHVKQILQYPESLVQRADTHPSVFLAYWIRQHGFATAHILHTCGFGTQSISDIIFMRREVTF